MKTISLIQPYATLVVIGAKRIETRSWFTKHRGDLLIHASKNMPGAYKRLCETEPFKTALKAVDELPLGKIIGKVKLDLVEKTVILNTQRVFTPTELAFGDFSPGRYGWMISDPVSFTNLTPVSGARSLWDFDERICFKCGCTDYDCRGCIEKTGVPCHWVARNLCSACANGKTNDFMQFLKEDSY